MHCFKGIVVWEYLLVIFFVKIPRFLPYNGDDFCWDAYSNLTPFTVSIRGTVFSVVKLEQKLRHLPQPILAPIDHLHTIYRNWTYCHWLHGMKLNELTEYFVPAPCTQNENVCIRHSMWGCKNRAYKPKKCGMTLWIRQRPGMTLTSRCIQNQNWNTLVGLYFGPKTIFIPPPPLLKMRNF